MVWPIIRGKSYVGETGKSMKVGEMVVAQEDGWRKIAYTRNIKGAHFAVGCDC
jgi:hypothetical protein